MRMLIIILLSLFTISCAKNLFLDMADKTSDRSRYIDAQMLMNNQKYDEAIASLDLCSADFKATEEFKQAYAGAQAGYCGLEFISFFAKFADLTGGGGIFTALMANFKAQTTHSSYCKLAETNILAILSGLTDETAQKSYQLYLAILSAVKIGTILHETADIDSTDNLGDGVTDATFSVCDSAQISDEKINNIITGFSLLAQNLAVAGGDAATINTLLSKCNVTIPIFPGHPVEEIINPCTRTDTTQVTAVERVLFRSLLEDPAFGVGTCTLHVDNLHASGTSLDCCKELRDGILAK